MGRYHNIDGVHIPFTPEEETARDLKEQAWAAAAPDRELEIVIEKRQDAYVESDKLFFEEQAGEVAAGTWAAKRAEIKARFPKD